MQLVLVTKSDKKYNLVAFSENLDRMYARVTVSFLDANFIYMLVPAAYVSSCSDFQNRALINTVVLENTKLSIVQQDWRKYITNSGNSETTHFLYHTHDYFRRNVHVLSLRNPDTKDQLRILEFGTPAEKESLAAKWQSEEYSSIYGCNPMNCLLRTKFGKDVLKAMELKAE